RSKTRRLQVARRAGVAGARWRVDDRDDQLARLAFAYVGHHHAVGLLQTDEHCVRLLGALDGLTVDARDHVTSPQTDPHPSAWRAQLENAETAEDPVLHARFDGDVLQEATQARRHRAIDLRSLESF